MLVLNSEDLRRAISPAEVVEASRRAFLMRSSGEVRQLERAVFYPRSDWWGIMTAYSGKYVVVKVVSVIPGNRERGKPSVQGLVTVYSVETGEPIMAVDGSAFTALRTAGASILSTELAVGRSIGTLGVIGAGTEARYHINLARSYLKVDRVLITARSGHIRLAQEIGADAVDPETLLRKSDVVFALTSSTTPVVAGSRLRGAFHVVSIGAHTPDARELDDDTLRIAKTFIVDSMEAVSRESGDYIQGVRLGIIRRAVEIGDVLLGKAKVERPSIFKSVGIPAQDMALGEALAGMRHP